MTDLPPPPPLAPLRVGPVSAGEGKTLDTLRNLWPHLWPSTRPDLKRAVVLALVALFVWDANKKMVTARDVKSLDAMMGGS